MPDDSKFEPEVPESMPLSSELPPLSSRAREIMCYSFMRVFAKDTISRDELAFIDRLALHDQRIDEHERQVLTNVFARITREGVSDDVWDELQRLKSEYGVG